MQLWSEKGGEATFLSLSLDSRNKAVGNRKNKFDLNM